MSEVLDRAARAAYEAYCKLVPVAGGPWDTLSEDRKDIARVQACAVLAAVKDLGPDWVLARRAGATSPDLTEIYWEKMIDWIIGERE